MARKCSGDRVFKRTCLHPLSRAKEKHVAAGREIITSLELKLKLKIGKYLIGKDFLMPVPFDIKKACRKLVLVYKLSLSQFLD